VAEGVWLDALMVIVDPSLRWGDESRWVVTPHTQAAFGVLWTAHGVHWLKVLSRIRRLCRE